MWSHGRLLTFQPPHQQALSWDGRQGMGGVSWLWTPQVGACLCSPPHSPRPAGLPASESRSVSVFATAWSIVCQAPLSMEFSRQEYWSGLLFPSPGDPSNPGIKPWSTALQADSLSPEPPWKPHRRKVPASGLPSSALTSGHAPVAQMLRKAHSFLPHGLGRCCSFCPDWHLSICGLRTSTSF